MKGTKHRRIHQSFSRLRYTVSQIPDAFAPTFGSTCDAAARTTPRDREKSLSSAPAIQSTLCTRRDNNLLTRTCRLRKEGPTGRRGMRTGLSYECEFLSRAAWLRGWKEKKNGVRVSWGTTSTELFVVTRIHQSLTRRARVSNGTRGLVAARR